MHRLLRLAVSVRGPLLVTAVAIMTATAAAIAQMLVIAHVVADMFVHPHETATWNAVAPSLAVLVSLVAVRAGAIGVIEAAGQRIATHVKATLRLAAVASLIAQGRQLGRERTGELVTTTVDGIEKLDTFYRRFVPQALTTLLAPLLIVLAVAFMDPLSAALLALTAPLIPLFMWLLGSAAARRSRDQWQALTSLGGRFLDTLQGLPTLTAFGRAAEAAVNINEASDGLRVKTMNVLRVAFLSGFVLELAASLSTAIVAASIGVRLIEGWITFRVGLAVLLLTPEFYLPFRQLGQRHHAAMEGTAAAERVFALIDAAELTDVQPTPRFLPSACGPLVIRDAGYSYPDSESPAVVGVSATFAPRTLTAIIGRSGAGKSTVLNLLLRLIEPTHGRLELGGRDSRTLSPCEWRQHFSFVPQRPRFIHASVAENLRMGRADASSFDLEVAARSARIDDTIRRLPDAYDTVIDENASALSGGERQRLAIARALLKQAPILILDEPTSSVDTETEALLNETLAQLRRTRTVIVVTHRLDVIRQADQIIHLDGGRLARALATSREVA
jgi:thiol reductant ABC exporter CydD subunit